MSKAFKHKYEVLLAPLEVGTFLCDLAAGISEGCVNIEGQSLLMAELRSISISIKPLGEHTLVKLKVKLPKLSGAEGQSPLLEEPGNDLSYKGLKKRMKNEFKEIMTSLIARTLPEAATSARFIEDSRLMTTFPGMGDEFYAAFLDELSTFEAALATSNIEALAASAFRLDQLKKECHKRFK